MNDSPTVTRQKAVCDKGENRSHVSWQQSRYKRCFTIPFPVHPPQETARIEAPIQIFLTSRGWNFKGDEPFRANMILSCYSCCLGDDAASILKGDMNKQWFLSQFHTPTADQTPEKKKPTYFGLPAQLWAQKSAGFEPRRWLLWTRLWIPETGGPQHLNNMA